MKKTIIESPYAGDVKRNIEYAKLCVKDCLLRNEAPFASHLIYTMDNILDDNDPKERALGINAGFEWGLVADKVVVYTDYGISNGMQMGIDNAIKNNIIIEYRKIL